VSEEKNNKPTVFISYSHEDEAWKDRLRVHLGVLEMEEHIAVWDDRSIDAGDEWYDEINMAMANAAVAICLVSAPFLGSNFVRKEEVPYLLERRERDGMTLIPILLRPCVWSAVPWLKELQMFPRDGRTLAKDYHDNGDEVFAAVAQQIFERLNNPNYTSPQLTPPNWPALDSSDIEVQRLPVSGLELFGRDAELDWLDKQWKSSEIRVATIIAWGGVGKSTLVCKWLERIAKDNYKGAKKVFAWSFYSQGTGERVTSADQFIQESLEWFGDIEPSRGSPWDKGQRLAALILESNALLILDGMEPLQTDNTVEYGKITDPALSTLLRELAIYRGKMGGLCLITSRVEITDLREFPENCLSRGLEQLSTGAGRALLRVGGVKGSDSELETTASAFGSNALALKLLASYLREQPGHDVALAERLPQLKEILVDQGRHARRVITALEDYLGEGLELGILRLLGLFDRPLERGPLKILIEKPTISGITDPFNTSTLEELSRPLNRLRRLGQIEKESRHRPDIIEAHPLVREHFRSWLLRKQPDAWREANSRLFDYYCIKAKQYPNTLEEMIPLFLAMSYGCAAERYQETFEATYWVRIRRINEAFNIKKLGAISSSLAALAGLFDSLWFRPIDALRDVDKALVLNETGFHLRALGKLSEAVPPLEAGLQADISRNDVYNAAISSNNLSELQLDRGDLAEARIKAEQAVALADKSENSFMRLYSRTTLADVLFQSGQFESARSLFEEAEFIQGNWQSNRPFLYSLQGYRYCDLLLELEYFGKVRKRAVKFFDWHTSGYSLLEIGLDHLILGRAYLLQGQRVKRKGDNWKNAGFHLDQAVETLRQAGQTGFVCHGLLTRISYFRLTGKTQKAQRDLNETFTLARRCGMKLFESDAHLEQAQLYLIQNKQTQAELHLERACTIIRKTGYHRRDIEIEKLTSIISCYS